MTTKTTKTTSRFMQTEVPPDGEWFADGAGVYRLKGGANEFTIQISCRAETYQEGQEKSRALAKEIAAMLRD